jgi:hypothetical protein
VVLAGGHAATWTEHIELLRVAGVEDLLVVATEGSGGGPVPDVPTVVVDPPADLSMMEQIRFGDRMLAEPPASVLAAVREFDPDGTALALGIFLNTSRELDGRPFLSPRQPEWVALEDKVVVDEFWDRAGVARQPARVVALPDAERAACDLDRGDGTVWAADAREGFHGGASQTYWVRDDASRARAIDRLRAVCDRVRVMPFVEGIPCSIHGIVLPDGVVVLQESGVAYAFVRQALPLLERAGIDLDVYYVASAELFDQLPAAEQERVFPAAAAEQAMGITGFTLPTMYRWIRSARGREFTMHPFQRGHFLASGRGEAVMEEAGLDGQGQFESIRQFLRR